MEGLNFVVEGDLKQYLSGSIIDYRKSWLGSGFHISSGNSCC
ncbi:MAG: hypothetical protein WBL90_01715 [bacterium]